MSANRSATRPSRAQSSPAVLTRTGASVSDGAEPGPQHILYGDDTHNVVQIILIHRKASMAGLGKEPKQILHSGVRVYPDHVDEES